MFTSSRNLQGIIFGSQDQGDDCYKIGGEWAEVLGPNATTKDNSQKLIYALVKFVEEYKSISSTFIDKVVEYWAQWHDLNDLIRVEAVALLNMIFVLFNHVTNDKLLNKHGVLVDKKMKDVQDINIDAGTIENHRDVL